MMMVPHTTILYIAMPRWRGIALPARAQDDTIPPVLATFDFSPKQLDTTSADTTITFTGRVTDNLSGVQGGWVILLYDLRTAAEWKFSGSRLSMLEDCDSSVATRSFQNRSVT